jgi:16S rRNA U516 pseudouridylate synthase RsuA-like enzyme
VSKEYVAKVDRQPTKAELLRVLEGCVIDGLHVKPLYADLAGIDPASLDRIRIVVKDGRNREVRTLLQNAGASPFHRHLSSF